jgi:hypothetical protein
LIKQQSQKPQLPFKGFNRFQLYIASTSLVEAGVGNPIAMQLGASPTGIELPTTVFVAVLITETVFEEELHT